MRSVSKEVSRQRPSNLLPPLPPRNLGGSPLNTAWIVQAEQLPRVGPHPAELHSLFWKRAYLSPFHSPSCTADPIANVFAPAATTLCRASYSFPLVYNLHFITCFIGFCTHFCRLLALFMHHLPCSGEVSSFFFLCFSFHLLFTVCLLTL